MFISAPLVNSFSLVLLLQKAVVVTDTIYVPGERSKSPGPRLQSLHAKSISLPSCVVGLIRRCQPALRKACTPRSWQPVGFPAAARPAARSLVCLTSPNRSGAGSCRVASASLQVCTQCQSGGIPVPPEKGRKSRQGGERKCWPPLGGTEGKGLF